MKWLLALVSLGLTAFPAFAVKLVNKDSTAHDITIKCSSTAQSSVGGSSTRDLGKGPCTVTVKKSGSSATASGDATLVIERGSISQKK